MHAAGIFEGSSYVHICWLSRPASAADLAHTDASRWKARRLCLATGSCRWQLPASSDRSVRSDRRTGTHGSYLRRDPGHPVHHASAGRGRRACAAAGLARRRRLEPYLAYCPPARATFLVSGDFECLERVHIQMRTFTRRSLRRVTPPACGVRGDQNCAAPSRPHRAAARGRRAAGWAVAPDLRAESQRKGVP